MSTSEEVYFNAVEAAAYLGVIRQRIYELAITGRLGHKFAGYWVFSQTELDAYKVARAEHPKGGRPRKGNGVRQTHDHETSDAT